MNIQEIAEDFLPTISDKRKHFEFSRTELIDVITKFGAVMVAEIEKKEIEILNGKVEIGDILSILGDIQNISINSQKSYEQRLCEKILGIVSIETGLTPDMIAEKSRKREIVRARDIYQTIMYFYSNVSMELIADNVGHNHASIYNSLRNCSNEHVSKYQYELILQKTGLTKVYRVYNEEKRGSYKKII